MGLKKWWRKKTKLEKVLIIGIILLGLVVLVLFIVLLSSARGVCETPECVRAATHILDTIDPSVDPCDNFYNFACGNFFKNVLPTTIQYLKDLKQHKMKEIVMETTAESKLSQTLIKQRRFYRACINDTAIEEDKDKTFLRLLDELLGGWPLVKFDDWNERDFKWEKTMVKAKQMGFFYQFFFRVNIYSENNTNMLWIKPPYEGDVSSFYWQEQNLDLIKEIAKEWGAKSVQIHGDLRRTMYFAEQLDQTVKTYYNQTTAHKPGTSEKITLKDLGNKWINVSWFELLTNLTNVPLKEDDLVVFDAEDYFSSLDVLLSGPYKKKQANYIAWTAISTNIHYMTKKIRDRYKQIQKNSNAATEDLSRSESCYKVSKNIFKNVAEGEYIRRYTPPDKRAYIKGIIKNIKQELKNALQKNSWMDSETREYAVNHLKNITESIGWTDIVYDVKKFERSFDYHKLKITSDKPINIARAVAINGVNHYYKQLTRTAEEEEEFLNTPKLDVNAYYLEYFNKLILPAPILHGQIFNQKRPRYMDYGSLGSIIGHEFTHAFMKLAPFNGLPETTWWSNTTRTNFLKATKCIVDEYDTYPEKSSGFNRNGSIFEENIADFSGVNFAYNAYQYWVSRNEHEQSLPGIKYTPNQIFWIMASTYLCHDPRLAERDQTTISESRHSVPSFRVIGPLRNSPYFADDFNCPVGSRMNPEKKCRIFS